MKITFNDYMEAKGLKTLLWQTAAAAAILAALKEHQGRASGKRFLMQNLAEFINLHGHDFEV